MKDRKKGFIALFIILLTVALAIWQWNNRQAFKLEAEISNTQAVNLNSEKNQFEQRFQKLKVTVNETRSSLAQKISLVFPTDENITDITRLFDDFEVRNNFAANPFFISNINYQQPVQVDTYRYVPINLTVEASKKNLDKFIDYIETSGSLESEVRLMSIEALTLTYPTEYGKTYTAKFKINAYFSQEI